MRLIQMSNDGDKDHIRILRIDRDLADVLRRLEADVRPRSARVG